MENPLEVWAKYGFEEGYTGIYPPILPMSYIDLYIYIFIAFHRLQKGKCLLP